MYSLSNVQRRRQRRQQRRQQRQELERRKRQCPREQSSRQLDPLLVKCLTVMGMPQCAGFFVDDPQMSFTRFIRMPLDRYEALGDVFVGRYAQLLDRIEALCASAFSMLLIDDDDDDDGGDATPGASDIDEPELNSHSLLLLRPNRSTRVPGNAADADDADDADDDAESFVGVVDDEEPPVPRSTNAAAPLPLRRRAAAAGNSDTNNKSPLILPRRDFVNPLLRRRRRAAAAAGNSDRNNNKSPLIPCRDLVNVSLDENGQLLDVCHHRVGECSLFSWGPEEKKKKDHHHDDDDDDDDSPYFIKDTQQQM